MEKFNKIIEILIIKIIIIIKMERIKNKKQEKP